MFSLRALAPTYGDNGTHARTSRARSLKCISARVDSGMRSGARYALSGYHFALASSMAAVWTSTRVVKCAPLMSKKADYCRVR